MTQYVLSAGEIVLRLPQGLTHSDMEAGHDPCVVTLVKTGGDLDRPCTLCDPLGELSMTLRETLDDSARELSMTQGH